MTLYIETLGRNTDALPASQQEELYRTLWLADVTPDPDPETPSTQTTARAAIMAYFKDGKELTITDLQVKMAARTVGNRETIRKHLHAMKAQGRLTCENVCDILIWRATQ